MTDDGTTPANDDHFIPQTTGIEFIGNPNEFGPLSFGRRVARNTDEFVEAGQRYWTTARRSAKAKKQLRHWKTKKWIKSRLNFDFPESDGEAARGRIQDLSDEETRYAKKKNVSGNPAKRAQQAAQSKTEQPPITVTGELKEMYKGIKFLDPAEVRQHLKNSDLPADEIENIAKNNIVITRDGIHMVVIPTELSGISASIKKNQEKIEDKKKKLLIYQDMKQPYISAGIAIPQDIIDSDKELRKNISDLESETAKLENMVNKSKRALKSEYDETNESDYYLTMAAYSLNTIEDAVATGVPEWRRYDKNKRKRPFIVNLEPTVFKEKPNVFGFTIPGSDMMYVNPNLFTIQLEGTEVQEKEFMKEATFPMAGVYTIHHELGHQVDEPRNIQSTWESSTRFDLLQKAIATGETGTYAESAMAELYAEAWALRQHQLITGKPYTPFTKMMSEAFGWDLKTRPQISPASVDPNTPYVPPLSPAEIVLFDYLMSNYGKAAPYNYQIIPIIEQAIEMKSGGDYDGLRQILGLLFNDPNIGPRLLP